MSSAEQQTSGTVEPITERFTEETHQQVEASTALDASPNPFSHKPAKPPASPQSDSALASQGQEQLEATSEAAWNPEGSPVTSSHLQSVEIQHAGGDAHLPEQLAVKQLSPAAPDLHLAAPATSSVLVTAKAEDADLDTSLTATSPSVWQLESEVVKQQQGHHKSYNQGIGHTSQSFPLPLLHAADSNEAGISGTLTGASDSRSDNIINESRLPPHLHLPEQLHRPALSGATDSAGEGSADESSEKQGECRGAKKPRLVWTAELHSRFMNAVNHLGVKNAVPKTILQLMNVDGMTRENVASHLQKYRLYLKKLGGLTSNAKTTPEALQAIQQQALQQQAHEAYQSRLGAMHGIATHTTTQGYFGPTSLMYAPPGAPALPPGSAVPDFQSAGPHPWYTMPPQMGPAPGSGNTEQQRPASTHGLQQMASTYGLLPPPNTQPQQQSQAWAWAPQHQQGGWVQGSVPAMNSPYANPPGYPDPSLGYAMPQSSSGGFESSAQHAQHPQSAGGVPDAMQHLLSAAEAASTKRK